MELVLYGYRYSVYTWIVRSVAEAIGVDYAYREIDPFADQPDPRYLSLNPFKRVPTIEHDGRILYETAAVTRYLDEVFNSGSLQRGSPVARARRDQIVSIVDAHGYWPMVRQVFSQGYFCTVEGGQPDQEELARGLVRSRMVLGALENLLQPDGQMLSGNLSLADFHLVPMVNYFCRAEQGRAMLSEFPGLSRWYDGISTREAFIRTMPDLR